MNTRTQQLHAFRGHRNPEPGQVIGAVKADRRYIRVKADGLGYRIVRRGAWLKMRRAA